MIPEADDAVTLGTMRQQILELVRRDGEVLAGLKTQLGRWEDRLDRFTLCVAGLEGRVDGLIDKVDCFQRSLPTIVRDAVREAFGQERERIR